MDSGPSSSVKVEGVVNDGHCVVTRVIREDFVKCWLCPLDCRDTRLGLGESCNLILLLYETGLGFLGRASRQTVSLEVLFQTIVLELVRFLSCLIVIFERNFNFLVD